jgi:phosphoadenosine phosphosulfate reductase
LLHWSESDVWRYLKERNIPVNPLYAKGYRSLGCEPCIKPTPKDGAERSGRSQDKEEIMARLRALGYW